MNYYDEHTPGTPCTHECVHDYEGEEMTGRTINMRKTRTPADAIRIDRGTPWGNPYRIGADGERDEVITLYKADLWEDIQSGDVSLEDLAELDRKTLACWCAPLACHGDVLLAAAKWATDQLGLAPEDRMV